MKKLFFITIWSISIIISIIWSYENPEKIESLKDKFKKNKSPIIENINSEKKIYIANSFEVHSKNHDIKYQADKFDLALKNAKLLDTLNLRLLITNLTNILNERDKNDRL